MEKFEVLQTFRNKETRILYLPEQIVELEPAYAKKVEKEIGPDYLKRIEEKEEVVEEVAEEKEEPKEKPKKEAKK